MRTDASPALVIDRLDHFVLTVRDLQATCAFYAGVLGMRIETFGEGRIALHFGATKINLHVSGHEFEPKARIPTPGSADLCFLSATPLEQVIAHLGRSGVSIEEGPAMRTGATGPLRSVYCRDPDGNLVEIAEPVTSGGAATEE
jgi:catechol 2,3-dioxygenase-like lactoylglutathione lyase family enzyme